MNMDKEQRDNIREVLKGAGIDPDLGGEAPEDIFSKVLKEKIPAMTSQAQYTAFMASFDALCFTMNAICAGDKAKEATGRKTLDQAFDVARKAAEITEKLRDVPEAATSAGAEDFKRPPAEFTEYDTQRTLLTELEQIRDAAELGVWYDASKDRFKQVRSQNLRNVLFDAVRAKNTALRNGPAKEMEPR